MKIWAIETTDGRTLYPTSLEETEVTAIMFEESRCKITLSDGTVIYVSHGSIITHAVTGTPIQHRR